MDFFERPTSNDEIASLCRFINWQNTLFKIRCWTFIAFYLDSIEISILLSIKSIGYGKSARRALSSLKNAGLQENI